ncbi:hypothetical protein G6L37_01540 [Agrobacterium rubi]|nr:hypothetical protein [Agrobacterium rubi]NTF24076.1 hypothetical protein [Agrobacterium rubi]
MTGYEPINEFEKRLRLEYINIAQRGVKAHLGRRISDSLVVVLFDRPKTGESIAALWSLPCNEAVTSENLPFGIGMLWDWDWRAELVEEAFDRLESVAQPAP